MARTASAKTVLNRTRTPGQKTDLPKIDVLSPKLITTVVQADGYWFLSHEKLEALFNEACEAQGVVTNADYESQVKPMLYNRIAAGVNQRAAKGDVPAGMRYSATAKARRGRWTGIEITLVPVEG